jgi:uncharacterized protein
MAFRNALPPNRRSLISIASRNRSAIDKLRKISIVMYDEAFEWDDKKAAENWRDHAISFEMARAAFNDGFAVIRVDSHHDDREERLALLGMVNDHLLFVSHTVRDDRIRIISARKAEPHEQRRYHNADR